MASEAEGVCGAVNSRSRRADVVNEQDAQGCCVEWTKTVLRWFVPVEFARTTFEKSHDWNGERKLAEQGFERMRCRPARGGDNGDDVDWTSFDESAAVFVKVSRVERLYDLNVLRDEGLTAVETAFITRQPLPHLGMLLVQGDHVEGDGGNSEFLRVLLAVPALGVGIGRPGAAAPAALGLPVHRYGHQFGDRGIGQLPQLWVEVFDQEWILSSALWMSLECETN
jgi:hypothetical protein